MTLLGGNLSPQNVVSFSPMYHGYPNFVRSDVLLVDTGQLSHDFVTFETGI